MRATYQSTVNNYQSIHSLKNEAPFHFKNVDVKENQDPHHFTTFKCRISTYPSLNTISFFQLPFLTTMIKGKLKIPNPNDRPKKKLPDVLGSLVSGFDDRDGDIGGSGSVFEPGEELETFQPNGFGQERECEAGESELEGDEERQMVAASELRTRMKGFKDGQGPVSAVEVIVADEKRSNLEYEVNGL